MKRPKNKFVLFKKKAQAYFGKIKFLLYFIFVLLLPVPYYDFYVNAWSLGSVSDYEVIKNLFRGEIHPASVEVQSYFSPLFLEVLGSAILISYLVATFAIKLIKKSVEKESGMVYRKLPKIKQDLEP